MEKFLPVSVRDFGQMITGNFVYVDKTRYVYEMVRVPQAYYFLSRPRRFGKSLTVSTLAAL
ncbi:MAG: AAA family ATPase, partial [bacterium]